MLCYDFVVFWIRKEKNNLEIYAYNKPLVLEYVVSLKKEILVLFFFFNVNMVQEFSVMQLPPLV